MHVVVQAINLLILILHKSLLSPKVSKCFGGEKMSYIIKEDEKGEWVK